MTYVLGINQLNTNAIICDTRITTGKSDGIDVGALKTGKFFPGTIYAITGSAEGATEFITSCKHALIGQNSLPGFWQSFLRFLEAYDFRADTNRGFQLLLSSRNLGRAQFYVLDSSSRTIRTQENGVMLGSGTTILDEHVKRSMHERARSIEQFISQSKLPPINFPYFYCLWLTEMAQGMEHSKLEEYGVGGLFHFCCQNSYDEYGQAPAVYVISAADIRGKQIATYIYRVLFAQGALVVHNPITGRNEIIVDTHVRPDFFSKPTPELIREIIADSKCQPFYHFCGFGFSDPAYRNEYRAIFSGSDHDKLVISEDGTVDP